MMLCAVLQLSKSFAILKTNAIPTPKMLLWLLKLLLSKSYGGISLTPS